MRLEILLSVYWTIASLFLKLPLRVFCDIAKDHTLSMVAGDTDTYTAYMRFADMKTARDLFDGRINAVAAVGMGLVRVGGMISAVDNVNRILDRVALYLA